MKNSSFPPHVPRIKIFLRNIIQLARTHQRITLWITIFSFYLVSAVLDVYTTNPGSRFMLTKNIARHFRFWIDPADRDYYSSLDYAEYNGKIYSDKPPLLAVLAVPLYWIGMVLSWFLFGPQSSTWDQDSIAKIIIVLGILIVNSIAMIRIHDILALLGYSNNTKYLTTISIAFGTLFFPYAHTFFSHDLVGSFLVMATYHLLKMKKYLSEEKPLTRSLFHSLMAGTFLGFAMGSEYFFLFTLPLFYLFALDVEQLLTRKSANFILREFFSLVIMTVPILACGLFVLWYNWINFGDPFTTAYEYVPLFVNFQHFLNPMMNGIRVLLFSNAHGLFLFTPLVFLAVISIPFSLRRHPSLTTLSLSIFIMLILYYSKYWKPDGGLNYGIRFLLPALPLFMINLASLLEELHERKNPLKWPMYLTFAIPSFIFSQAGGWISIFPSGGEGMQNPLFGDETGEGHVSRFHRFIKTLLNPQVLLNLILDHPFSGDTSATLLRQFPLLAIITLTTFMISFILSTIAYFSQLHVNDNNTDRVNTGSSHDDGNNTNSSHLTNSKQKITLLANLIIVALSGLYVMTFIFLHIHVLAKELSTIPNVEEKFKIYPEDLQIMFLVFALYATIFIFLIIVPRLFKTVDNLGILGMIGIMCLVLWLFTFIPPLDKAFNDTTQQVVIFFLILYHWGLGLLFVYFVGSFLKIIKLDLTTMAIQDEKLSKFLNIIQVANHSQMVKPFSWLFVSLLTLFIFGRVQGFVFFLTFYLYRVNSFSMAGLVWNVAITIEVIGLIMLVITIAATLQQHSTGRGEAVLHAE